MADNLMENVNRGVGIVRTQAFDVEDIIQYFGIKTQKVLTPEQTFQRILPVASDILQVKTDWLNDSNSTSRIVKTLNTPAWMGLEKMPKDNRSGKLYDMLLNTGRGDFDTDRLALGLIKEFSSSIVATSISAKEIAII